MIAAIPNANAAYSAFSNNKHSVVFLRLLQTGKETHTEFFGNVMAFLYPKALNVSVRIARKINAHPFHAGLPRAILPCARIACRFPLLPKEGCAIPPVLRPPNPGENTGG